MRKKNNIKRHINLNLIIIFLLIIFLIKSDFFRNLYFLNQDGYTKRMVARYGYCAKECIMPEPYWMITSEGKCKRRCPEAHSWDEDENECLHGC